MISEEMDISLEQEPTKKCIKCEHYLYDSLRITYNPSTCMIVLWNKVQIFIYEDRNLNNAAKVFVPEFLIQQLVLCNNYLLCLDTSSNVHATSLKFKNPAQKRFKSSFQPREQNICALSRLEDHSLSLKYEGEDYYLCLHRINIEFQLEKKVKLKYVDRWALPKCIPDKCILATYKIKKDEIDIIKEIYPTDSIVEDCSVVFTSFDRLTIFSCLFSTKMTLDEVFLVKIYTCPSDICDMDITDLTITICLTSGTIVRLNLKDKNRSPKIVHLNIAIHNCLFLNEGLIYTDGISMWRTENTFSDKIIFKQFITKHVKDFVKCGDQLICTTYSNLIYIMSIENETSYLKTLSTEEYCSAEKLLNNSEYLYKILEEIERNNDLVKKVKEEGNYITALSLSNRQDIMDNIVQTSIIVYENYEDVNREHSDLILTDDKHEYFEPNPIIILTKITATTFQHMFNNVISNLLDDLMIHIALFSNSKLLKETSIKLKESLKKLKILMTCNVNLSELDVYIKIVSSIPGCHDQKQSLWTCLYWKHVRLCSEHFINTSQGTNNRCLKDPEDTVENLILKTAQNYHKQIFKFIDTSKIKSEDVVWSLYLKLPENFKQLLIDNYNTREYFNSKKVDYLLKQYTSEEFLNSKSDLLFEIQNEKVKLQIINDFSAPVLKVASENVCIAYNIRNFFSKLIYNDFKSHNSEHREYVKYTFYNIAENLQKELKACIQERYSFESFRSLAEQFERNIGGTLPI